jgi:hypothetical protein
MYVIAPSKGLEARHLRDISNNDGDWTGGKLYYSGNLSDKFVSHFKYKIR